VIVCFVDIGVMLTQCLKFLFIKSDENCSLAAYNYILNRQRKNSHVGDIKFSARKWPECRILHHLPPELLGA
jgi:hypothetical protein